MTELTREQKTAKREAELLAARNAPRLDPKLWMPPVLKAAPGPDPGYLEWRAGNRPYRRAFGRGERWRQTLLAVGAYNAKAKDAR